MRVRGRERERGGNKRKFYSSIHEPQGRGEWVGKGRLREAIARSGGNVNSRNNLITDPLDLKVEAKLRPLNVSARFRRVNS